MSCIAATVFFSSLRGISTPSMMTCTEQTSLKHLQSLLGVPNCAAKLQASFHVPARLLPQGSPGSCMNVSGPLEPQKLAQEHFQPQGVCFENLIDGLAWYWAPCVSAHER